MSFDMNEERIGENPKDFMGVKWRPMLVMSILFHLAVFSLILFLPESMSTTKRFDGIVYEVDLVELPHGGEPKQGKASRSQLMPRQFIFSNICQVLNSPSVKLGSLHCTSRCTTTSDALYTARSAVSEGRI